MRWGVILIFCLICLSVSSQIVSTQTGSWATGSTWVGGTSPTLSGAPGQLASDVTVETGHTVTLSGNLTVKSGTTLTIKGTLEVTGETDFQNGCTVNVSSSGVLTLDNVTNSNNSTDVTIDGKLNVTNDLIANAGSEINGSGTIEVTGETTGNGLVYSLDTDCDQCIITAAGGLTDVIIDGATSNIDFPIDCYYRYSYTEMIILQSQLGNPGDMEEIFFKFNGNSAWSDDVKIFLGHTSKTEFSGSTDWITSSGMTEVYDGTLTVSSSEDWYGVTFSTNFTYNNTDNLVLGVLDYGYDYHSSGDNFYTESTSPDHRAIYFNSDTENPDPSSPPTADGTWYYVPSIKMQIDKSALLPVELLSFKGSIENSNNKLEWITASESNNDFFTVYKSLDAKVWEVMEVISGSGTSTESKSYTSTDFSINRGITYYKLCQTDFDGTSECFAPISLSREAIKSTSLIRTVNILGQEVGSDYYGIKFDIYDNGSCIKSLRLE